MPLYNFTCPACGTASRRVLDRKALEKPLTCRTPGCAGVLQRTPTPPTCTVTETLDNGLMTKRLERPADAERLYRERAGQVMKEK